MPALAAVGGMVTAMTVADVAVGMAVASFATSTIGKITGSKTLQKIGGYTGIAAGVAGIGSLAMGGGTTLGSMFGAESAAGAGAADALSSTAASISDVGGATAGDVSRSLWGAGNGGSSGALNTIQNVGSAAGTVGQVAGQVSKPGNTGTNTRSSQTQASGNQSPDTSKFKEFGNTLKKYDTAINVLGGVGDAYLQNQRNETQRKLAEKQMKQQQSQFDVGQKNTEWQQRRMDSIPNLGSFAPGALGTP